MDSDIKRKLLVYRDQLVKWQKSVNLVAPGTIPDAWERHFEDSLQLVHLIRSGAIVADIGSGAGFPGLVIAIARPDLMVHLIESDAKKGTFLLNVSRETGAQNVHVHMDRIESVLPTLQADVVTARALAPLSALLDLCDSQKGAHFLFLKGREWQKEVDLARKDHVFDLVVKPSKTDPDAAILCITGAGVGRQP